MTDIMSLIGIGISAFIATNIDDIFVLVIFFSSNSFKKIQVVVGQYLGISLLIIISTFGALISLVIPQYFIRLLGLVPITIGVIKIVKSDIRENNNLLEFPDKELVDGNTIYLC